MLAVTTSCLAGLHASQIELHAVDQDAVILQGVDGLLELLGRLQQRLGGDAADIQARAAEVARFSTQAVFRPSCAARMAQT